MITGLTERILSWASGNGLQASAEDANLYEISQKTAAEETRGL